MILEGTQWNPDDPWEPSPLVSNWDPHSQGIKFLPIPDDPQETEKKEESNLIQLPGWAARMAPSSRYKVAYGGRGGSKSWTFGRILLLRSLEKSLRILCARELQVSIKDSVHMLLERQAMDMGLAEYFDITKTSISVPSNDSEFIFKGLRHNVNEIKSLEGIDICWVEEAQAVSSDSWKLLIPTIRESGSEIWISFNPDLETDPTYERFVLNPPPDAIVIPVGWEDNPWFPEELRKEKDYLYSVDPETADQVWGGKCRQYSSAQILRDKWVVDRFSISSSWKGPYFGIDWGFSTDPLAMVECWIDEENNELILAREAWGLEVELDDVADMFKRAFPGYGDGSWPIRADNSRPETISHVRRRGLRRLMAADKWPGSVEDGIEYLRNFRRIRIHEDCKHSIFEAKNWKYKIDTLTGDVLPIIIDANNHCWDGVRYALQPLIRNTKPGYAGSIKRSA